MCRKVLSSQHEQLESMENGLLRKPVQEEILEKLVQDSEGPQQPMHAAQPRPCSPVEEAGEDDMGVLGKDQVVAGGGAGVEEQRPAFWDDGNISAWWPTPKETELDVDDGKVIVGNGGLVMEFGAQDSPPLLQQQQKLLAPPPQEPWPPPIMAAEHGGSGAGISGERRLELKRKVLFGDGLRDERAGGGKSDRLDGSAWERAGIGTGAGSRAFWGCEVTGRRLTRQRRARVREK